LSTFQSGEPVKSSKHYISIISAASQRHAFAISCSCAERPIIHCNSFRDERNVQQFIANRISHRSGWEILNSRATSSSRSIQSVHHSPTFSRHVESCSRTRSQSLRNNDYNATDPKFLKAMACLSHFLASDKPEWRFSYRIR
jgi:hypothetical protein